MFPNTIACGNISLAGLGNKLLRLGNIDVNEFVEVELGQFVTAIGFDWFARLDEQKQSQLRLTARFSPPVWHKPSRFWSDIGYAV